MCTICMLLPSRRPRDASRDVPSPPLTSPPRHCLTGWPILMPRRRYTLYETHLVVTDQIAYSRSPLPPLPQQSLAAMRWRMTNGQAFVDEARRAFLLMDANRDELISAAELRAGLFTMGLKLDEAKLQSSFALADTDGSGDIDFDEFLEFVGTSESEASRAIKGSLLGVRA